MAVTGRRFETGLEFIPSSSMCVVLESLRRISNQAIGKTVFEGISRNTYSCNLNKMISSGSSQTVQQPKYRNCVCWLRNDLRYHDNEVILWAHENSERVMPLYCFDPRHFGKTYKYGFPKTGPFRAKFLLESVQDMHETLKTHGSKLSVFVGKPEEVIASLLENLEVDVIVYQKEVTKEETDVEAAVQNVAKRNKIKFNTIWGSTLYHEDDLRFSVKFIPDTYTEFRKSVEAQSKIRILKPMPDVLKPLPTGEIKCSGVPSLVELGVKDFPLHESSAFPFKGGETAALQRLNSYFWESQAIEKYKETRNGLIGSEYSTKFSCWLAFGCISPRYIYHQIKSYERERTKNDSTYWVIFELIWRDYFRFVCAKYGNLVFYPGGIMQKKITWKYDLNTFQKWADGQTGVPFVDANMRELLKTGWMSNRGRQNVASFLTKDLQLDWRLGAEWFEYLLIDYDVCSNYGNWNYSAGIGNDPRENRKFNMIKQGTDYDSEGNYIRTWVPELQPILGSKIHIPWTLHPSDLHGVKLGVHYPFPILVASEWTRHFDKTKNPRWPDHRQKNQKGIDFYFKNNSKR
ncbi:unnamed protein product [Allacma fusca]|uniref:Cryptochrome DASH n=1 Tax=Allacma fusca TaxID=39272 RepID=A0A8J2LQD2_9HEXA|nr:unnamed protein product [Allacma fusca]